MTDLNSLVVFASVSDAGSFSEASRRLGIPVSTVSRKIADLESDLGNRLFERSTRQLRLTDVGSEVLQYARQTSEISDALVSMVSSRSLQVRGNLRLSAPPSISDTLLIPLITEFNTSYPDVRVSVLVTERHVDHVSDSVDLAMRVGPLKDSALVARRLVSYRHRLLASPQYIEKHGTPETPEDLAEHRLLAFAYWKEEHKWTFCKGARKKTIRFEPHISMNDYHGLGHALLAGNGIGDMPEIVCLGLQRSGRLIPVLPSWQLQEIDLSLVHLGGRHVPAHVRLFSECATKLTRKILSLGTES